MQTNKILISIVIPVYNEAKRIEPFLFSVIDFLRQKDFSYEIVIVDDGSIDNTVSITESLLSEKLPGKFKIHKLPVNKGKGAAIRAGMLASQGEFIFFIDADGSTSITEIDNFTKQFDSDHDVYIAIRTIKHKVPFKRKFFGYGYIYLANFLLQLKISDFTCGFKCYTQKSSKTIFFRQTLNNWSFDAEDIYIARKYGFRIKEIPVKWTHVGESKVKVFKYVIVCALDLVRIRYNNIKKMYA